MERSHVKSQKWRESLVNDTEANFYKRTQRMCVKVEIVSFGRLKFIGEELRLRWRSYKLQRLRTDTHEKCAQFVHEISRLIH